MSISLIAKNIKFLRKSKGWNQSEMSAKCGIKASTWSNYENAFTEPSINLIIKISNLFGISIDHLLSNDLEKESSLVKDSTKTKQHSPENNIVESLMNESEKELNSSAKYLIQTQRLAIETLQSLSTVHQQKIEVLEKEIARLNKIISKKQ